MQGQNSKENQDNLVDYYNKYVTRQKSIGVNLRHKSIANKLVENGLKNGANLLEIGCGIGTFSSLLPEINGKGANFCVDISDESIKIAQEEFKSEKSLKFSCVNAVEHDFGKEQYDTIVLPDVIEHIPIEFHAKLFQKLDAILKKDGFIFIHIPNPHYLEWCHKHKPELLQIIDQPIYTDEFIKNLTETSLHINTLKTYSIWIKDHDYQFIILKKNGFEDFNEVIEEKISTLDKIKYKLNARK